VAEKPKASDEKSEYIKRAAGGFKIEIKTKELMEILKYLEENPYDKNIRIHCNF
jgi:hypothetical protein